MPENVPQVNETTNAVLKEMIIGLTKITDDRLLNLKEGVAEIKLLMQGFATTADLDLVKKDFSMTVQGIRDAGIQHNKDDKESFAALIKSNEDTRDTIKLWRGISIGASLIGSPIITILIALFIFYVTTKK